MTEPRSGGPAWVGKPVILRYRGHIPSVAATAWIAPTAVLIGDVRLEDYVSVWFGAIIRADDGKVVIGSGANVQDCAVVHPSRHWPVDIGEGVTIGHHATVHGSLVGRDCLIGMGAVLLNGCNIGAGSIVGAGAVVPEDTTIPSRSLVLGVPARVIRPISEAELANTIANAKDYVKQAAEYGTVAGDPSDAAPSRGKGNE